jgi:uncharacterized protein YdeI (BOF family)
MSTSETPTASLPPSEPQPRPNSLYAGRRSPALFAALLVAFAIGGGVTATALQVRRPAMVMLTPAPITSMHDWSEVAVKGQVAEIFGNKFIIQDDSGRTLVDTGPRGEGGTPMVKGETVTVQGHFDNGFIHANVMTRADGTSQGFGPSKHPHPEHGPGDRPGPRADRGPGPDREAPPPRPEG